MIVQEQKMKREKSLVVQAFYDISTHSPRFLDTGCRRDLPHLKVRKFLWANRSDMHCISFCLEEVSKIPHIPGYMRVKNLTNKHYRSRLLSSTAGIHFGRLDTHIVFSLERLKSSKCTTLTHSVLD